ncbi:MAG: adenosylmethionine--8-amino-7-oxononanoate transaminase [bacterium]
MNYQKKLSRLDKKYIWHPFTQMQDWIRENPLIIKSGKGINLTSIQGKKYIDGISSLWVNIHGHNNPAINNAIIRQMKAVSHSTFLGLTHEPGIVLAEELMRIVPQNLGKVFYSDNGSTSVEAALKMAYQYWQQGANRTLKKTKFLSLTNAYHGDTLGSVAVGGMDLFHKKFHRLLFEVYRAPSPYCYRCPCKKTYAQCGMECAGLLENMFKKYHRYIAGFVIEPMIQGAAGMIVFPKGYMKAVETLCRKYNVLLIVDEVATGFGRTGKMFACEHERIKPDIMCVSKGISGGYLPLAATIVTNKIYNKFLGTYEKSLTFFHGHSYTANPLACAAATANIRLFSKANLLKKLTSNIDILSKGLRKISKLNAAGDVRQCGLMAGIELVKNKRLKTPYSLKEKIGIKVCACARKFGLILRPLGNVVVLMPPPSITKKELNKLLLITEKSIKKVTGSREAQ